MKNGAKAFSVQPLSALRSFRSLNARKAWVKPMRIATHPRIRTMTRPQDMGANRQLGSGPARARRSVPVLFGVLLVFDGFLVHFESEAGRAALGLGFEVSEETFIR